MNQYTAENSNYKMPSAYEKILQNVRLKKKKMKQMM